MASSKETTKSSQSATFGEHLDVLRTVIIRALIVVAVATVVAFAFKDQLFALVLAPHSSEFFLFRLIGGEPFRVHLVNVDLTEQFMAHIKVAMYAGLLVASPYVLYLLFGFVSPALYANEHRYAIIVVVSAYAMFVVGTALNYCLIFPLTVRFLGTYSVSADISNMLSLQSYIDTLLVMNLMMGLIFELPVVAWILGRMRIIDAGLMSRYRRHAIVAILILAAIITPTTDVFTLLIVSLPIWLLYEASLLLVPRRASRFARE